MEKLLTSPLLNCFATFKWAKQLLHFNNIKMKYALKMFDEGCDRIQEAMDAVGINSYSHLNYILKKHAGKTASKYISEKVIK